VLRAVEEFESLGDIGHVRPQAQPARALPKCPPTRMLCAQSGAREGVHRLAQPDMALAPELFGRRSHVVI
jgi:hypothetical protein